MSVKKIEFKFEIGQFVKNAFGTKYEITGKCINSNNNIGYCSVCDPNVFAYFYEFELVRAGNKDFMLNTEIINIDFNNVFIDKQLDFKFRVINFQIDTTAGNQVLTFDGKQKYWVYENYLKKDCEVI